MVIAIKGNFDSALDDFVRLQVVEGMEGVEGVVWRVCGGCGEDVWRVRKVWCGKC